MTQPTQAVTEELRRSLAAEEGGRLWIRRIVVAAVVVAVLAAGLVWRAKHRPPPPAKYVSAAMTVGDVFEKVQATGAVQPVLQVSVGAQTNGRVTRVLVDFNSVVKKGDVLAEIDPTIYGTQVNQQIANLAAQRAQVASARANADAARVALERTERLVAQNIASRADLDAARGRYDAAQATADAQIATIGVIEAQLKASRTNVAFTKIYSPVDGVVVSRGIDPGATIVTSFQTQELFLIAQDLHQMRVLADVDEADVGRVKEKMLADAVVDAFPGESFQGIVQQVRIAPNNQQGVVTYSAVVEMDNPEEKLRPGMTATISIRTREAKGVKRIPNAALRYRPTPPPGPDGKPLPEAPEPPLAKGTGRVYVLLNDKPGEEKIEPKIVQIGASDGIVTEIVGDGIPDGAKLVIDEMDPAKKKGPFG